MRAVKTYDIRVEDSVCDPRKIKRGQQTTAHFKEYQSRSDKTYYRVYIYLEGKDLPFVKRVKYKLHSTFRNPVKTIERTPSNPNCTLVIWTWGIFNIKVEIEDINGETFVLDHPLTYGSQIADEKIKWEQVK